MNEFETIILDIICKNCGATYSTHRLRDGRCCKNGEMISKWAINKEKPWEEVFQEYEDTCFEPVKDEKIERYNSCLLSIYDTLKLADNNSLDLSDETLSEIMFRKMKAYDIDLNKELGFTHLKPVTKNEK